jgi:hypothetical protein
MRGSIVKRGKGYAVVVELDRDPLTGKRRQKWHSGYRTKKLAEDALSELVGGVKTGTYVARTKQTLSMFVEDWLTAIKPTRPSGHPLQLRQEPAVACPALPGRHAVARGGRWDAGMVSTPRC